MCSTRGRRHHFHVLIVVYLQGISAMGESRSRTTRVLPVSESRRTTHCRDNELLCVLIARPCLSSADFVASNMAALLSLHECIGPVCHCHSQGPSRELWRKTLKQGRLPQNQSHDLQQLVEIPKKVSSSSKVAPSNRYWQNILEGTSQAWIQFGTAVPVLFFRNEILERGQGYRVQFVAMTTEYVLHSHVAARLTVQISASGQLESVSKVTFVYSFEIIGIHFECGLWTYPDSNTTCPKMSSKGCLLCSKGERDVLSKLC